MNNKGLQVKLFSSGYCTANSGHVFPNEPHKVISFNAIWALINHPVAGKTLFDTGYSTRFFESTRFFPNRIYRWITPVVHDNGDSCLNQLQKMKIDRHDITNIVISHFHADHTGGLKDFPNAAIWCKAEALSFINKKNRFNAVLKGVLKSQIPDDISARAVFPEKVLEQSEMAGLTLWKWHDDMYFVDLPGHFRGQTGLYLKGTVHGDLLLCADAVWSARAISQKIYPSKKVSLIIDDYSELTGTMEKLNFLQTTQPNIKILPTHCHETMNLVH